ncbi:MAG: DNA topoisomerase 3 [Eubacterium sp.]|nr:DNA topoisomerase 3 [Eubacterium sp.]
MKLILAEKPSVARDIARVVGAAEHSEDGYMQGNGYIVFYFWGHLIELADASMYDKKYAKWSFDNLPIFPDKFKYVPLFDPKTKETLPDKFAHLQKVKKLMENPEVDSLICATDAGREGEVIFRYVYDYLGCKKPYKRLWISSLTDESIRSGMSKLIDGSEKENLFFSGAARAQLDWLVGMNLSRLYSLYFQTKLSIGRVQTATLNMIVQRDLEIANFKKKPFYKVVLENGAEWFDDDRNSFSEKSEAEKIKALCQGKTASVVQAEKKKKTENRPFLHSLNSLQMEANDKLGFSAAKTLSVMQELYVKHLLTYPRTESNYLTEDMKPEIPVIINLLEFYDNNRVKHFAEVGLNIDNRVIDNSKVSDHHAIIPTKDIQKSANIELTADEKAILDLVIQRFFLAFEQPYVYNETAYVFEIEGNSFKLNVKEPVSLGWKAYASEKSEEKQGENKTYNEGDTFTADNIEIKDCETVPPKAFTESTLLSAMENVDKRIEDKELKQYVKARGLGTTATRADIIEKIIRSGYIIRDKKALRSTEMGRYLIAHIPETIKSVEMTAEMESQLVAVENGQITPEAVIGNAMKLVREVMEIEKAKPHENLGNAARTSVGKCPKCGGNVYEGQKGFYCEHYKDEKPCYFTVWKDDFFFSTRKKTLTAAVLQKLLEKGKVLLKGCYSEKSGKTYDAYIGFKDYTDKNGKNRVGFTILEFANNNKDGGKKK